MPGGEQGQARNRQNKGDKLSYGVRKSSGEQGRCLGEGERERKRERGREINTFLFHRCLCGKCEPMVTAEESQCCRELDAYWALVENVTPTLDVQCLTLHPGFEACYLNPYVLQIAYMHFRQEHGPLQASRHEQYRYIAYRQVVRWAYGILGRHIRKPLPACVVSAIRRQFPEEGGLYKGFEWPHFDNL
ncbi:P2X purinoceptor 7 [Labeo rohita]|uniref:P2X purinoceptor 7 n=1 Tax=Labeo rohita TaxID=84645 RepID=A0ABQ8LHM1_LABRO|nr:P2X purinoceptor 7 [Labeo rohita]